MISPEILKRAMREISAKKGPFTLFALFMRVDAPGTWDLVVAAPWLEKGRLKALSEFTDLFVRAVGENALQQLSRIVTLRSDDPALTAVTSAVSVEDGEIRVQHSNFFGLEIEDAIIFQAKKAA